MSLQFVLITRSFFKKTQQFFFQFRLYFTKKQTTMYFSFLGNLRAERNTKNRNLSSFPILVYILRGEQYSTTTKPLELMTTVLLYLLNCIGQNGNCALAFFNRLAVLVIWCSSMYQLQNPLLIVALCLKSNLHNQNLNIAVSAAAAGSGGENFDCKYGVENTF